MRSDLNNIIPADPLLARHASLSDVGSITKVDGHDGSVLVKLSSPDDSDVFDDDFLLVVVDGNVAPLRIDACQMRGERSATVHFARVKSVSAAEMLVGCRVCALQPSDSDATSDTDFSLVGYSVSDSNLGLIGSISDIDDRVQANPIFVVQSSHGEVLIPAVDEFIVSVDDVKRLITMDIPQGLVSLNDAPDADDVI